MGGSHADILSKQRKPQVVKEFFNCPLWQEGRRIHARKAGSTTSSKNMNEPRPPLHPSSQRSLLSSPLHFSSSSCPTDTDTDDEHGAPTPAAIRKDRGEGKGHKKSVSFSSLEIREYEVVIGDHPCCSRGVPVSLGWEYSEAGPLNLDEYEEGRSPRRSRFDLRTSSEERSDILSDVASQGDLRRAQRKMHRVRSCSAKLAERVNAKFFDGPGPAFHSD
jgi:hypothetical protein